MPLASDEIISKVFTLYIKGRPLLSLTTGEILRGRIIEIKNDNTVQLSLKGKLFNAKTEVPLKRGDSIIVKVESTQDKIRLKLIGLESSETSRGSSVRLYGLLNTDKKEIGDLVKLIDRLKILPQELKNRLPEIKDIIKYFSAEPDSLSGDILKTLTESSGVAYETKLKDLLVQGLYNKDIRLSDIDKDLKALLLRLAQKLNDKETLQAIKSDNIPLSTLRKSINQLLRNIEYHQIQSRLNDALQTYLPLLWHEMKDGELVFRKLKRGVATHEPLCCFIRLNLERYGNLITNILYQKGFFHIVFYSESAILVDALEKNNAFLKIAFESSGLRLSSIRVSMEKDIDRVIYHREGLDIKA